MCDVGFWDNISQTISPGQYSLDNIPRTISPRTISPGQYHYGQYPMTKSPENIPLTIHLGETTILTQNPNPNPNTNLSSNPKTYPKHKHNLNRNPDPNHVRKYCPGDNSGDIVSGYFRGILSMYNHILSGANCSGNNVRGRLSGGDYPDTVTSVNSELCVLGNHISWGVNLMHFLFLCVFWVIFAGENLGF